MAVALAPDELAKRLTFRSKLNLGGEIVRAYVRIRWDLWHKALPEIVAAIRGTNDKPTHPSEDRHAQRVGIRLGQAVGRTLGALPSDSRCLIRSLVLMKLLADRGIESSLVIAVRSDVSASFAAHAWVERAGVPLLPPNDFAYERLVEL